MSSIHLIGGGWDEGASRALYGDFARRVAERGGRLVYVLQNGTSGRRFLDLFATLGLTTVRRVTISAQHFLDFKQLRGADGVFVCGGVNPLYQRALADAAPEIRALVQDDGVPYAGFSAGAVVAAEQALVGGWRTTRDEQDVEACAERRDEGLRYITVAPGVGLVPFAVDVHGTQWGTISRAVHALEASLVDDCVLVDENTSLDINDGLAVVRGIGSVYRVHINGTRVVIETYLPGNSFRVESSAVHNGHTANGAGQINPDLEDLRAAIADEDAQIIEHLGRRLELVAEVADVKGRESIAVMQPGQMAAVLARVERLGAEAGIRAGFPSDVYERIIAEACRVEDSRLGASRSGSGHTVVLGGGVAGHIARQLLSRCGFDCTTVDLDPHASPDLVADVADPDRLAPLLQQADVVVFATPLSVTLRALVTIVPTLSSRTIVVEFMSSKSAVAQEIENAGLEHEVIGLNPLFGSGLKPLRPVLLHVPYRDGPRARSFVVALQEGGIQLIDYPDAEEHDSVCSRWQALAHATVLVFGLASVSLGEDFDRSGRTAPPPHRLLRAALARMLRAADPATYEEIQFGAPVAGRAREALATAAANLAEGDVESWRRAWGALRESIPVDALADGERAFLSASRALVEGL